MASPVIVWIERHGGYVTAWCAEHASEACPPAGLVSGVYTFVLLAGWSPQLAKEAQDWVAAQDEAQVRIQAAVTERAIA